ncbi:hypothetical protein Egran_05048 [Elaphomyces granulatus]|uniref:Rhodopsin domain-containing protein n=1 Tax=Elaphomyces granulatus TaxID=519963 RepID=A0A232LST4_9EURO|nr:hypothetical protein Egran_05048 [Elaphomyces granulatus]
MSSSHLGGLGYPDDNIGPNIVISGTIVTMLALVTVLVRIYVRVVIVRNFGLDDWCMAFTMLLSVVGYGVVVQEVKYGAGRHLVYLSPQTAKTGLLLNFVTQPIYLYASLFVKISIGLFLLRFAKDKKYRVFIKSVNMFMALYTTACFFTIVFQCENIRSLWDTTVKRNCFPPSTLLGLSYTNATLNILTDLTFALLPAIMLRNLKVNKRTKASLICILGLGLFACVAAIIKFFKLSQYGKEGDFLWDSTSLTIWIVVETNTGIIAGSLPALKPIFKKVLQSYGSGSRSYGHDSHKLQSLSQRGNRKDTDATHDDIEAFVMGRGKSPNVVITRRSQANTSEESILPNHGPGILRTTVVTVSKETICMQGSDMAPNHVVEDRV